MSEVLKQPAVVSAPEFKIKDTSLLSYTPAFLAIAGTILVTILRFQMGGDRFISDGALIVLALAGYLTAAVFYLTNIYAPSGMAQKLGLWFTTLGVFFNFSSWGVRWIAAHDREL